MNEGAEASPAVERATARVPARLWRILKFAVALFFLVGALQLMKTGAAALDVLNGGGLLVRNAGATFGLGWLGALVVLSGAPVIATGLALVAAGSISEVQGFTMMAGARLGAAFVVLVVAVVYALRGGEGERFKPVSTAIMALATTAVIYVPGTFLGLLVLRLPAFRSISISFPHGFSDLLDIVYGGIVDRVSGWPPVLVFLGGLAILVGSFKLLDAAIPELNEDSLGSRRAGWLRRKWPMFGLGCLVAMATMSVSVALTVLVPLVAKKSVKREDIVPYIMGANVGTLGDKLLPALALDSPAAIRIVLAGIVTTLALSVIALTFLYPQIRTLVFRTQRQILKSKTRLAAFTGALVAVPLLIIEVANLLS
ncbi:MAG TPA: hypothetical protein VFK89_02455 [Actinomycetota bacterium]|nr:hypothetical protein [Actinomycetota bacterium]